MLTARDRAGQRGLGALPLHPILAGAYPVLFLFAVNADDLVTLDPLWLPLGLVIAASILALGVIAALRRDLIRAALVTTVLVVTFFGYGHARNLAGQAGGGASGLFLAAWLGLAIVGVVVAWRAGSWAPRANAALNVVSAILVAVSIGGAFGPFLNLRVSLDRAGGGPEVAPDATPDDQLPDIYYLIFDRYARADVLRDLYGYDNSAFVSELEERGFFVADETYANYFKTPLSLVSSLNMEYLDAAQLEAEQADPADRKPIHRRLRDSLTVPAALTELGYTYHHIANWWQPSATNADADAVYQDAGPTEYAVELLATTLMSAAWQAEEIEPFDWRVFRSHHEYELAILRSIASEPGPKYVFAHLLLPHEPYVFDRDGSFRSEAEVAAMDERENYRRQLTYLNDQILQVVDRILAESDRRAVIILQADEGPFPPRYRDDELAFDWHDATEDELREKAAILNAYRLPGSTPEGAGLYPEITPVNTFRIVFNTYLGASLPLLPDRVYAQTSQEQFFDLFEITDTLHP